MKPCSATDTPGALENTGFGGGVAATVATRVSLAWAWVCAACAVAVAWAVSAFCSWIICFSSASSCSSWFTRCSSFCSRAVGFFVDDCACAAVNGSNRAQAIPRASALRLPTSIVFIMASPTIGVPSMGMGIARVLFAKGRNSTKVVRSAVHRYCLATATLALPPTLSFIPYAARPAARWSPCMSKPSHSLSASQYQAMYARSVDDPDGFWKDMAGRLDWGRAPTRISDVSWDAKDLHIKWYEDGQLNVSANCLDRHLATRGEETAIIFEGADP